MPTDTQRSSIEPRRWVEGFDSHDLPPPLGVTSTLDENRTGRAHDAHTDSSDLRPSTGRQAAGWRLLDVLDRIPARWSVALTVIAVAVIAACEADRWAYAVTTKWCVRGCGDRLDYVVRGECSCLPERDAPTLAGLGGHE